MWLHKNMRKYNSRIENQILERYDSGEINEKDIQEIYNEIDTLEVKEIENILQGYVK